MSITAVVQSDSIKLPLNVSDGTRVEIPLKTDQRAGARAGSFFPSIRDPIGRVAWLPRTLAALVMALGISAQAQNAAPTAPSPQTEMQKWLADLDAQWQATFKREVSDPFSAELDRLKIQYRTSIEAGIKKASDAGDLDGALALLPEQKRFAEASDVPPQDEAADPPTAKLLRAAWRAQLAQMEKDRAARAKTLLAKYDQVLAQAQTALAQRQRLDDALLVKARRDEVAAAWLAAIPAAPPPAVAIAQPRPPLPLVPSGFTNPLKDQIQILPFVQCRDATINSVKFEPQDARVPDELSVTVNGQQIQIAGIKKSDVHRIMDKTTGHHGKLVLMSAKAPLSGTLLAKVQSSPVRAGYYIVAELANGTLKSQAIALDAEATCDWSVKIQGPNLVFSVTKQGQATKQGGKVGSIEERANEVKNFGFGSTVRYPGNEADLTVTVNPARR